MGTDSYTQCRMNPDGSFKVKFFFDTYNSGDQCGPEFTFVRVDTGTYREISKGRFQFTVTHTEMDDDSKKCCLSTESMVGSQFVVTVGAKEALSGYPMPQLAWASLPPPKLTQEDF
jgi:hypothetical protein